MNHVLLRREAASAEQLPSSLDGEPREAARWILAAAEAGETQAQALLGQILLDGRGIARDAALARRWFAIAAARGHAMAANMLGRCLELGWGGPVDLAAAARSYRQAADAGLDWGLYNYANLLATGRGVAPDDAQALACYRRAAELGHAKSMNLVGRYCEEGRGEPPTRSRRWSGTGARPRPATSAASSATPACWPPRGSGKRRAAGCSPPSNSAT